MSDFDINELIALAKQCQFTYAKELLVENLTFMQEVRDMCAADKCHNYNKDWTCPPGCGTLEEIRERTAQYKRGIIVQTVGEIEDGFDYEGMQEVGKQHKQNFYALTEELQKRFQHYLPMGAGGCDICEKCTYPQEPCRFPEKAFPSMEAYGLFVNQVCELSGLSYNNGNNTITYTSCYLIRNTI